MKTTKSAMKNVLSKLNAVRVTLSNEEQAILDSIVVTGVSAEDEVIAHAMQPKSATSKSSAGKIASIKSTPTAMPEEDEVMAHSMNTKSIAGKSSTGKLLTGKSSVGRASPNIRIAFDEETGQYIEK